MTTCPHCSADLPAEAAVCPACLRSIAGRRASPGTVPVTPAEKILIDELRAHTQLLQAIDGKVRFFYVCLLIYLTLTVIGIIAGLVIAL